MVFTSLAVLQSKLGFAACVTDNAQCEVSDGSNQFPGNMTFVPSGTGESNAALIATSGSNIYGNNITINTPLNPNNYAGFVGAGSYIYLTDSTINSWFGLRSEGMLVINNTQIETQDHGIQVDDGYAYFSDTTIKVNGAAAGLALNNNGAYGDMRYSHINASGENAVGIIANNINSFNLDNVKIDSLNNTSGGAGIRIQHGSRLSLDQSTVTTQGAFAPALAFIGKADYNYITLDNSAVNSQDAFAIQANGGNNYLSFSNTKVEGDKLAFAGNWIQGGQTYGSYIQLTASNSQLFGHASMTDKSRLFMHLYDNALWTLRPSAAGDVRSTVSVIDMDETSIVFEQAGSGLYQELVVDEYLWGTNSSITFNTLLNKGGVLSNQSTDRLLVNGNIYGNQTLIYIKEVLGSPGGLTSPSGANRNNEGISLIQVSGNASEHSFALAGGYITMSQLPYEYRLYAYGPGSSNGRAAPSQRLVDGTDHWDFRLQSTCTGDCPTAQVVPQVANYLIAPTALFQAGLQDISSLQQRLGDMRQSHINPSQQGHGFFLRGYGSDYDYRSNLNAARYGYDADIQYAAVQMGGHLYGVKTDNGSLRFGLAASSGDLAFTPHREGARKSKMNVWSASPYFTWQHDLGAYLDVVLSYGRFNGQVNTAARGRTARLQGHHWKASIETGIPVALGSNGWSVEPQLQLIHQKLKFDPTDDVDHFPVKLGEPEQTTARVGGQLSKQLSGQPIKLYGKLNVIHSFADNNTAWFGDAFEIGRSGSYLESGAGMQIALSQSLSIHSEASWQQHLSHGIGKGRSLNLGLNWRF